MSRLRADLLLLFVALIWGGAFVPQKLAYAHIGGLTFVFSRFLISAVLVLPFAWREWRQKKPAAKFRAGAGSLAMMLAAFCAGVLLQQLGLATTTATNAGFFTGLYVLFVPLVCRGLYRHKLSPWIFPAVALSLGGTWLLSGGVSHVVAGDALVILCAAAFGVQVAMLGVMAQRIGAPLVLAVLQYAVCAAVAGAGMMLFESPQWGDIMGALWPILYAGVLSGGIAYTLQVVAQQYTQPSDAAIIMSGENIFAALAGAVFLGERLAMLQYAGAALIVAAMLVVELAPLLTRQRRVSASTTNI